MRHRLAVFIAVLVCIGFHSASGASPAEYDARSLSGPQAIADIDLAERLLTAVHPGYERYTPADTLERAWDDLRATVSDGTTDEAMYLAISRTLAMIRCDHTKAELPAPLREHREQHATHLPVRTHVFGGRLYAGANRVDGLMPGEEILAINGMPADQLIGDIAPLISIDGNTEHARTDELCYSSEYMGSGLDTFLPLMHGWSDAFTFRVRTKDGAVREVSGDALTFRAFEAMVDDAEGVVSDFDEAVSVERLDERTALLRVDTFVNYRRPVDPTAVYAEAIRPLNEEGVDHLIVDIRRNGGGSTDAAVALVRHLVAEPFVSDAVGEARAVPFPPELRESVTTWDESVFGATQEMFDPLPNGRWRFKGEGPTAVDPAPDHFRGRVTLLSSSANASGSTMLLGALQQRAGLRVVGEPTGGNIEGCTAGTIVFCDLPHSGVRVRVPLIRTVTGLRAQSPGMGVTPNVVVPVTAEAFFAGQDEALEAARR